MIFPLGLYLFGVFISPSQLCRSAALDDAVGAKVYAAKAACAIRLDPRRLAVTHDNGVRRAGFGAFAAACAIALEIKALCLARIISINGL